jgi:dihydropteroate synthase
LRIGDFGLRIEPALNQSAVRNPQSAVVWKTARGNIPLDWPVVAGILNVTPDSFSDGGQFVEPAIAIRHAETMVEQGADLIDIGAESTRPGRPTPVSADEEWRRLEPVLTELVRRLPDTPFSVDTVKSETARRALEAGAWVINDVSGLHVDPELAAVCARAGCGLILMHSRGSVREMATYDHARYRDVVGEVAEELAGSVAAARDRGVAVESLVVDPGLGFSKRPEHNYAVLRELSRITALGFPVMVGPSRKRFLAAATDLPVDQRDPATAAACVAAYFLGAGLFRVHNVALAREALAIAHTIRTA